MDSAAPVPSYIELPPSSLLVQQQEEDEEGTSNTKMESIEALAKESKRRLSQISDSMDAQMMRPPVWREERRQERGRLEMKRRCYLQTRRTPLRLRQTRRMLSSI
jgi:hypothetical protein